MKPSGHTSVMASRTEAPRDSLDFFPTPPWATRALFAHVIGPKLHETCWEPAAGEGHMAEVLRETFASVHASDVHDYGKGYPIGSFTGSAAGFDLDRATCPFKPDWIITNPPFNLAAEFAQRSVLEAAVGVALLVRVAWLEGGARYRELFNVTPPSQIALFCERVPMSKGRWDPDGSTATAYAWVIWNHDGRLYKGTQFTWIPPGSRTALERPLDRQRFGDLSRKSVAP